MKTIILCGGLGTRISEETQLKPKPMVEIGGRPILWHIMKIYEQHGQNDFVLALGYKSEVIKDYFLNYHARLSDLTVQLKSGEVSYSNATAEDWRVSLIDTGPDTMTGGRLLRLKPHLQSSGTFMLTYGDGVSDVDVAALLAFHKSHGKLATVTAVRPPVRFGELSIEDETVVSFQEKPQAGEGWINGGFFVFEPGVLGYQWRWEAHCTEKKSFVPAATGRFRSDPSRYYIGMKVSGVEVRPGSCQNPAWKNLIFHAGRDASLPWQKNGR